MKEVSNAGDPEVHPHTSVLLIGPVGSGKTTAYRTLPGKKFVYLFDPNAEDAIRGSDDIDYVVFTPDVEDVDLSVKTLSTKVISDVSSGKRKEPKTYAEWEADWEERYSTGFFNKYDWVGFDSATTLSEIVMDRVQFLNKRLGKHPEQADYTAEMNTMKNIVRAAASLSNVFITVHTETQKDELTGKIHGQLVLTGKNRIRVPLRFAHIFGFKVDKTTGKPTRYMCLTTQDRQYPTVRTSFKGLDDEVDVTLDFNKDLAGQGIGAWFKDG